MLRKDFLKFLAATPLIFSDMKMQAFENITQNFGRTPKMPMLFIGHGSPMNALFDNSFTQTLRKVGKSIEKPNAIMVISAHWETRGTYVSLSEKPATIYDFGGFDPKLYEVKYDAKGDPELAKEVIKSAFHFHIQEDHKMGLDHGAWTVLKHLFPNADIPVFQMSMDYTQPASYHFELAKSLRKMREKGVMIIGSGNIVHNLRLLNWKDIDSQPFDWAFEFDEIVKNKIDRREFIDLVNYQNFGNIAQLSIPTNDHYMPMIYTLGLADKNEEIQYIYEGYQYGSLSMRCFQVS